MPYDRTDVKSVVTRSLCVTNNNPSLSSSFLKKMFFEYIFLLKIIKKEICFCTFASLNRGNYK